MQSESEEEEEEEEESSEEEETSEEDEDDDNDREIVGISDAESYSGDDSFEGESDSGDESSYEEVHESKMGFLSRNKSNNRKKSYSTTKPTNFTPKMGLFNNKEGGKKQKKPLATTTSEKTKGMKLFGKKSSKKQVLHQKPVVGKKLSKAMQPGNQKNPFGVKKVATPEVNAKNVKGKKGKKTKGLLSSSSKSSLNKKPSSKSLGTSKSPKTLKPTSGLPPLGETVVIEDPSIKRLPNETEEKVYYEKLVKEATYSGEPPSGLPLDNANTNLISNIPSQSNYLVEKTQSETNDASTKDVENAAYPQTLNPNGNGSQTNDAGSRQLPPGRFISAEDFKSSSSVDIPGGLPTSAQPQIIGYYIFSNPGTPMNEGSPINELQNLKENTTTISGDNLMVSTPEGNNYSFKTKPFYSNELSENENSLQPEQLNKTSTSYSSGSNNITRNIVNDESNNSSPLMTNSNEMKYMAKFQPTVVPNNKDQNLTLDTTAQTDSIPMNDGFTTPTSASISKPIGGNTLGSDSQPPARILSAPLVSTTEAKIAAMKAKGVKRLPREANGAFGKRGKDDPTVPRSYKKGMPKMKMGGMFSGNRSTKSRKETKKIMSEKEKRRSKIRESIVTSFS